MITVIFVLKKIILPLLLLHSLTSCGRVYFPIEISSTPRSERLENQEKISLKIVPMKTETVKDANSDPYRRYVVDAGNPSVAAKFLKVEHALVESFPTSNDPGPYVIGVGDVISLGRIFVNETGTSSIFVTEIIVKEDGYINIIEVGAVRASGLTQNQLEDKIYSKFIEKNIDRNFEISITGFNSKQVLVVVQSTSEMVPKVIPFVSTPMYLESIITELDLKTSLGSDVKIVLLRQGVEYVFSASNLLQSSETKYRLYPNDKIFVQPLNYKSESVLIVGETGAQKIVPINSFLRPTLSDTLFSGMTLNNVTSDFSQIYVIRERKKVFNAFHLDITNPARIRIASKFEMRPDDIVFVATQPLSLYSRTLSQILGSTGLTLQARDTIRTEIGN